MESMTLKNGRKTMASLKQKCRRQEPSKNFARLPFTVFFRFTSSSLPVQGPECATVASLQCTTTPMSMSTYIYTAHKQFIYLFTNDKGRLAPLTCHTVETLKSRSNSINTKASKNS